ncbi:GNAT family N-acetyltransferase [Streptosporangium sp. NBC_01755]|uniref:GNAT family N-acetyltransferase n=1 Tax=unclassified Streptosporangium TaxID=2632669 RepID=UPI002DDB87DB|nr:MULTISPECIES: GNAT family N-acetyltransferase [unclassified Streptosporangium]WSA27714.1 GNAT family N-acetyltransferase [Streptosporangium sp. NBC_01810]WSD00812.1 GNAT family N-acetyltransferase [Streptosporangium sp. NBC_01755]
MNGPTGRLGVASFHIQVVGPKAAASHLVAIADVGGDVFTLPPWREPYPAARGVAARLLADSKQPGFVLALALGGEELYGFAYGVRCSHLARLTCHEPGQDFTLKELGVLPQRRGLGLGAALHDAVLARAVPGMHWLTTHPCAAAALGLYRARGWRAVALTGNEQLIMSRRGTHCLVPDRHLR